MSVESNGYDLSAGPSGSEAPIVSVVVPNLNGESLLPACLTGLRRQRIAIEIILVDNGSTDSSVELARQVWPGVRVLCNTINVGFAGACAQGIAHARGELILLLNTDAVLSAGSLDRLVEVMESNPEVGAAQPVLRRSDGRLDAAGSLFTWTGFLHHVSEDELAMEQADIAERFSLKGACMLMRRCAYDASGGLDKSYFAYFEESDLCWRMRLLGWRMVCVNDVTVVHDSGETTRNVFSSEFIDYLSFRNRLTTIRANAGPLARSRILPVHVALCIAMAVAFAATGKVANALGIWRAMVWQVRHGSEVERKRAGVLMRRTESDAVLGTCAVRINWRHAWSSLRTYLVRW